MAATETISLFATLAGLLSDFKSLRSDSKQQTIEEYLEWLRRRNHAELAEAIQGNAELAQAIANLLGKQHDEIMRGLRALDSSIQKLASTMPLLRAIVDALGPERSLSAQAIAILRWMNDADASQFIELKTRGGTYYQLMDGSPRSQFDKVEQRFMESDLGDLCELRLLMLNYNANGSRIFQITREGAALPGISGDA